VNYKNLKINEEELSKIKKAEKEIYEICKKYNVYLRGSCDIWDSEYDYSSTHFTTKFWTESKDFEKRIEESDRAYELQYMYKKQDSLNRFLEKYKKEYPDHLNLEVYKEEFTEPSGWKHDALFVRGLRVKDWNKIKIPTFGWNPNKFWQYQKQFKNDEIRASLSMSIYPKIVTPTFFSIQGNINCKLYEECKNKTDILSHAFLIQMIDELLILGALELI
jgi:hypothetical protein